ncbi:hypothetical protein GCM10025298_22280 [Natronobiforma cellulositropha]
MGLFGVDHTQSRDGVELGLEGGERFRERLRKVDTDEQSHTDSSLERALNAVVHHQANSTLRERLRSRTPNGGILALERGEDIKTADDFIDRCHNNHD